MQLSFADTNTISKWTKMRFHKIHVTLEFYRVLPKQFLSLWYVWRKLCTYLSPRLALSPNRLNQASIEPCHLAVPSGASKTIYEPMVCLAQTVHLSCTDTNTVSRGTKWDSTWPMSPRSSIWCVQNDFWASGMFDPNCARILRQD
jgi:hypothetical protein